MLRPFFPLPMQRINWFPGHMTRASRKLNDKLQFCDVFVEVRDARIPYSSENHVSPKLAERKHRIVILNKIDLCNLAYTKHIMKQM
jgi:ribosome biogenesis GTPase A